MPIWLDQARMHVGPGTEFWEESASHHKGISNEVDLGWLAYGG